MSSTESHDRPANRLAGSTSPYLLQHACNPVDWYPWGEEALARARAEDKPIFLSIGYAACHWCHVMERESFENEQIAAVLNAHFVAIKVDREERPDLDDLYMQAVQLMTGQGGWPMSMFLTPEGIPFFGGTYFPPEDHYQRIGFGRLLARIHELWETDREKVLEQGAALAEAIGDSSSVLGAPGELGWPLVERATTQLGQRYDARDGGFGGAPKFPPSMAIALLLREYHRRGEPTLLEMAEHTLQAMARGGMYDQLAGGFHRYSTDAQWLVPHFEKMLYDNALLAPVYFDAARLTGNAWYAGIGREVLDWVLGEMTDRGGGFYSTLDADSEGVEGKFFTWRPEEVQAALGAAGFAAEAIALFEECYDVTGHGNWHEAYAGGSILHLSESVEAFASRKGLDAAVLGPQLRSMRAALLAARAARVRPGLDDKILTNWNALMISALCSGAQYFGEKRYAQAARAAAEFIWRQMRSESADGSGLLHASRAGRAHIAGFLEDYAYLLNALLDLYETEFRAEDLERATWLGEQIVARFHDAEAGGFFTTDGRDPSVIARLKDFYDGATPSGNSMAVRGLLRLSLLLDRADLRNPALDTLAALAGQMERMPPAHHLMLCTLADHLAPMRELAIIGRRGGDETTRVKRLLGSQYLPARVIAWAEDDASAATSNVALLRGKQNAAGQPVSIYVCQNFACAAPVHTAAELAQLLKP